MGRMPTGLLGKARYEPQAEHAVIHSHGNVKDSNTMHYGTDGISGNTYAPISANPEGGGGHLATHRNLLVMYIPRVRILIGSNVPRVGNFGIVAILDNGKSLEMSSHCGKYPEGIWINFLCS